MKFNWFLSDEFKKLREDFKPIGYKKANKEKIPPYTHNQYRSIIRSDRYILVYVSIYRERTREFTIRNR